MSSFFAVDDFYIISPAQHDLIALKALLILLFF